MTISILLILLFIFLNVSGLLIFKGFEEKWKVLLVNSILLYIFIAQWAIIAILLFSLVVFLGGRFIEKNKSKFAYYGIILLGLATLLIEKLQILPKSSLPESFTILGISYITFNGLSYLFDVRKGYIKAESNYWLMLLYLLYFPYISAGPMHRYKKTVAQFKNKIGLSDTNFSAGFRLILWGLFKNIVLTQRLKKIVDSIIDNPEIYHGVVVLIGGVVFIIYLYCDFSSYIDIFQGTSQIFGIKLTQNFRSRVYLSHSRKHYWEGWHITLNHWFRDYVFYPIARNAKNKWQFNLAMLTTFSLIGIWHEVSWKFLIWGLINGCWIITENKVRDHLKFADTPFNRALGTAYHLMVASVLAIIFRTNNLTATLNALFVKTNLAVFVDMGLLRQLLYVAPLFIFMDYFYKKAGQKTIDEYIGMFSCKARWAIYVLLAFIILSMGLGQIEDAYYRQF